MSDWNYNNSIPPTKNINSKFGQLILNINQLTFFNNNKYSCVIKVQFWGAPNPIYIPLNTSQNLIITASLINFKHYLIDSKVMQLEIVDNRNYKPVGIAYLNWLTHLRSIEDKQTYIDKQDYQYKTKSNPKVYYLPFFDEKIIQNLAVYNYSGQAYTKKQQKIGQLSLSFECRIYQAELQSYTGSKINSAANLYNIRVSQASYNRKNQNIPNSVCNFDFFEQPLHDIKTNKSIISKPPGNSPKMYVNDHPHAARKSKISILQNLSQLRKVKQQPEITDNTKTNDRVRATGQLELQLIRMRLQMQQLVGVGKKSQNISLQIVHYQSTYNQLSCKDIVFINVKSESKQKTSQWKIFPQTSIKEKAIFNSPISVYPASLLSFALNLKKGKDSLKGSLPIDCIRDIYDINILSNGVTIVGFVRVKVQRKTQISIIPQVPQQIKFNNRADFINQQVKIKPKVQSIQQNKVQVKNQNNQNQKVNLNHNKFSPPLYYVFIVQQLNKNKIYGFQYRILDGVITQSNLKKMILVQQEPFIGKNLIFSIFKDQACLYEQKMIQEIPRALYSQFNLTCSLIFEKKLLNHQLNCQLYAGTLQQVNYLLQNIDLFERKQPIKYSHTQNPIERPLPTKTQQSNKNSLISPSQMLNRAHQKRKMKTEVIGNEDRDRRLTEQKVSAESLAMQKFDMRSENQGHEQQNVYLVDILTRFLDSMPQKFLPEQEQMPKEAFLQLIGSKSSILQYQVIDIIISIFQEVNSENINLGSLLQCLKAYRSFYKIYIDQKNVLMKQILQGQPKALQRIKNNSQFGTLNQSMLWGRALSKIKDPILKQKINKYYKISSFGTTDSALLIQDLEMKQKQLRVLDIGNLGMLIKQWVEQFITKADLSNILNLKQKLLGAPQQENYLNIRGVSEIIQQNLELRLSLWESLMLIEQVKGCYGCDLDLEEGVITTGSLFNWIDSVHRRVKIKSENSQLSDSHASLDAEQLALIQQINKNNYKNESGVSKKKQINRISESKSLVPVNNDSDIMDIANLLREKDGFLAIDLIQQTKTKNMRLQNDNKNKKEQKILQPQNNQIIQNKKIKNKQQQLKLQRQILNEKQKQIEFFLQIKQFKLYNLKQQSNIFKSIIIFQNIQIKNQQHFYYLTYKNNFTESNGEIIRFQTNKKSLRNQSKGIQFILKNQQGNLIYSGLLPTEQINQWIMKKQSQCKRTIVIYANNGKISGKYSIQLLLQNPNKNAIKSPNDNQNKIGITINSITPFSNDMKLYVKLNSQERRQIAIQQNLEITIDKPIYHCEITITNEDQSYSSIISLEQLYLKGYIHESYPLIDSNAGIYIANLMVTLIYKSKNIQQMLRQSKIDQTQINHTLKQHNQNSIVCLVTQIKAISYKCTFNITPKLQFLLYKRDQTQSRQKIGFISPQFTLTVSQVTTKHILKSQKIQLENEDLNSFIQFKLVQNGKVLSYSQKIALWKLKEGLNSNIVIMNSVGNLKAHFAVIFKKCIVPTQKYALRRILDSISEISFNTSKANIANLVKNAKLSQNLTITEQKILKQICENNFIESNYIIINGQPIQINLSFLTKYPEIDSKQLILTLINEFIYFDFEKNKKFTGTLQKKQLIRIIKSISQMSHTQIMEQLIIIIKSYNFKQINNINYLWILFVLQSSDQPESIQVEQKKALVSQIDVIYQSLKMKYG